MLNFKFYEPRLISSSLVSSLHFDRIKQEVLSYERDDTWIEWPETYLREFGEWDIIPFVGFGKIIKSNCERFPLLWSFIQSLSNVRLAILSRMGPETKLNPHRGWGTHSNNVIRCHFGIKVPQGTYVAVFDEPDASDVQIRRHKENTWICFDDSKYHAAGNASCEDRIVLIVDIERPNYIEKGTADIEVTNEVKNLLARFE